MYVEEALSLLRQGKKIAHKTALAGGFIQKFAEGTANETFVMVNGKQVNSFHFSHIPADNVWDNDWKEYEEPAPAQQ